MNFRLALLVLALAVSFSYEPAFAAERGQFGISLAIEGDSFFNPTLKSVTIAKVVPNSPAAKAGIAVGDQIIEVEGHAVPGTKADVVKPYLLREVGQVTHIVIRKQGGEQLAVALTAAPKD